MGAAIWSSPLDGMSAFPAETFLQFCINHGLLQIFNRPQWKTVRGGAREYVRAMLQQLADVRLSTPVLRVTRESDRVVVNTTRGEETFDIVVLACHSDQALDMLADARPDERDVLGAIRYQPNTAWLHTDASLMPSRRRTWSAWNYYGDAATDPGKPVAVTYWLNRLQALPFTRDVFVTLNPPTPPAAGHVLQRIEYAHPLLDTAAYRAQKKLPDVQGRDRVYFCGAWTGYGFHEDGLKSGMAVARLLGAQIPWEA
jgi:predicted NAD/FAD-binding protein